ncbi:MAG: cupin domain-containing protein [Clostridia bacterium]|nr:cupin domain-containing protein [Clostridia bacterium]
MYYEPIRDVTQTPRFAYFENIYAPLHFHQAIELVYCLEGSFRVQSGSNHYLLHQNEIAFFPSYFPHALTPIGSTKSITFMLPFKYFEIFSQNNVDLLFQKLDKPDINLKIRSLIEECRPLIGKKPKNDMPDLLFQGYAQTILALIIEHYDSPINDNYDHIQRYNKLIIGIIQYIENHSKEKINLDVLATEFGYSKWYFSRFFNKTFNCSLPAYINSIRLSKIDQKKNKETNKTHTILDEGFSSLSAYYKTKSAQKTTPPPQK